MALLVLAVILAVAVLLLLIAFPPARARRWRHATRPIRRLLRPRHYRAW